MTTTSIEACPGELKARRIARYLDEVRALGSPVDHHARLGLMRAGWPAEQRYVLDRVERILAGPMMGSAPAPDSVHPTRA